MTSAKPRLHFGFLVILTYTLTSFCPLSFGLSCAGIFYPSLAAHLGVGTGILSYYTSILWLAALLTLPFLGKLVSKLDARICTCGAIVLVAADLLVMSQTFAIWQFFVCAFVMGIGIAMLLYLLPSTLINRWFSKRAGFYIGIAMAFTGIGGVIWSSVGGVIINSYGWSAAYIFFAIVTLCTLPFGWLCVRSYPADKGLLPHGYEGDADASATPAQEGMSAAEAFKTPAFRRIMVLAFLINFGMYFYFVIPSYISTLPISVSMPLLGATAASAAMAGQTIVKVLLGYVGEKHTGLATAVATGLGLVGIVLFLVGGTSPIVLYIAAFLFGFEYGVTNVMMPIYTRKSFGTADYANIYSRISMVCSVGSITTGFIWGTVVQVTGSYVPMAIGLIVVLALGVVAALMAGASADTAQKSWSAR